MYVTSNVWVGLLSLVNLRLGVTDYFGGRGGTGQEEVVQSSDDHRKAHRVGVIQPSRAARRGDVLFIVEPPSDSEIASGFCLLFCFVVVVFKTDFSRLLKP